MALVWTCCGWDVEAAPAQLPSQAPDGVRQGGGRRAPARARRPDSDDSGPELERRLSPPGAARPAGGVAAVGSATLSALGDGAASPSNGSGVGLELNSEALGEAARASSQTEAWAWGRLALSACRRASNYAAAAGSDGFRQPPTDRPGAIQDPIRAG